MKKIIHLLAIALILTGCEALTGKEVGRLPVNQLSTDGNLIIKETTLELKKDEEIGIWSDMDLAYEGNVALRFQVEVWKDGARTDGFEIDPTDKNITLGETRVTIGDKTDWSFLGKNLVYKIKAGGTYTFKAILVASENPTLQVNRAEIVFKK